MDDEEFKTFKEWKRSRRYVRKGQKAYKFNEEGVALFSKKQTAETIYTYEPEEYTGVKYEENIDFWSKASPYATYDRIKNYDLEVSDEDWRKLMIQIERIER